MIFRPLFVQPKRMVKVAEADINSAKINLEKTKPLVEKNIISKFDLESVESVLKSKEAQLAQAQANLENAKANLQYTLDYQSGRRHYWDVPVPRWKSGKLPPMPNL